jgi:hypothetical protein
MKDTLKTCIIILGAGLFLSVFLFIFNLTGGMSWFGDGESQPTTAMMVIFRILYYARDLLFLLPILIFFNAFRKQL